MNKPLQVPVLTYGSETMEKSRIRVVQMNNLKGLLGIRKMNKIPNE